MAEAYDVALAPHCPLGPIALAACLQLDFVTPNFLIQEQAMGIHYNERCRAARLRRRPGRSSASTTGTCSGRPAPGLGIEIDEEAVRAADGAAAALAQPRLAPRGRLVRGVVSGADAAPA